MNSECGILESEGTGNKKQEIRNKKKETKMEDCL